MPDTKIELFAKGPVKVDGKRIFEKPFHVNSQEEADALIACGAAIDPKAIANALDAAEQVEAKKLSDASAGNNVVSLVQPPESDEERAAAIKTATISLQQENDKERFTSKIGRAHV